MLSSQDKKPVLSQEQVSELAELVKLKFSIEKIEEQFDSSNPQKCYLKFSDNLYLGGMERENLRPLNFLKTYGGIVTQEKTEEYWTSTSVCEIAAAQYANMKKGLEQLKTPNAPDNKPSRISAC